MFNAQHRQALLIQQAYSPQAHLSSEDQRRLQQELFDIQKRPEAWGLVLPFLNHDDPNVQFFGAHTIQVKIARDWSTFPEENTLQLRDLLIDLSGRSMAAGRNKVVLRKLYVAMSSLAIHLCPKTPSEWPDWPQSSIQSLSTLGAPVEALLDYLEIVAEEVASADLLQPQKIKIHGMLVDCVPMVAQAVNTSVSRPRPHPAPGELQSALKCFQAWLPFMRADALTPLIPLLIDHLTPAPGSSDLDETEFTAISDALQEIMSGSALSNGSGSKTLTEPLLLWFDCYGSSIIENTIKEGFADGVSHSYCKLLVALGDQSTQYLATNLASSSKLDPVLSTSASSSLPPKSHFVQTFLRQLMAYSALPGYYGVDEEESEGTLGFWYLFQEALWEGDPEYDSDTSTPPSTNKREGEQMTIAKAVYSELAKVLQRKVTWPPSDVLQGWPRDQKDKFQAYRRDVGDTLLNAYYILRDDLLAFYINDIVHRLSQPNHNWEDIEADLHCVLAVQEGVPLEENSHLNRLFGSEVLGALPNTGAARVRRTMIVLIGTYATWFTTQYTPPPGANVPSLLMNAISYVVAALPEPALCLPAANSLRDLCDANRAALAPHISAFGELHANLTGTPDIEKCKVLQSIASVIQALPPEEEIPPVEAIVSPVIAKLYEALQSPSHFSDEVRAVAVQQFQTIAGVARGLTRTNDSLLIFDDSPDTQKELERMKTARDDPRVVRLRDTILDGIRRSIDLWSTDASIGNALSELYKAITALPSDVTLLSLNPGPLLELLCIAAQKQLTAVWLSLAQMLIIQLDPPSLIPSVLKSYPGPEARQTVFNVLSSLLPICLGCFSQPGAMEDNPDIMQAFFSYLETVAQHFISVFYQLPPDLFYAVIQCATSSLALQERYSLVSACSFLASLLSRTAAAEDLGDAKEALAQAHGRSIMHAILSGLAGVAPRSATLNLVEVLNILVTKYPPQSKAWMTDILFAPDFTSSRATNEAKDKFIKTIFGTRQSKRTRDAAQQFTLVARGLEGSAFGFASVTM
ncbi:hypothetical protein PHLGIDRAFT_36173 [Phlebiopsis gigantea 11061_1 CR5-6]|uniref:Importin-13 n=1 Tax=Phlebiopsis gigantea (strain 11061_1 CR5-6) TaxID=745531 RepID=A0A0C3S639_PHLG1|nr:hypothetical protein PHLGIDRAFT_36173 [Phlebiopsis gigantea 11061_1 CR5-6]